MSKSKKLKSIPKFKNEDEERDFWATADTSEYFDWDNPIINPKFLDNIQLTSEEVTLSIQPQVLRDIKSLARRRKVSYKTMMANFLAEKIQEENLSR